METVINQEILIQELREYWISLELSNLTWNEKPKFRESILRTLMVCLREETVRVTIMLIVCLLQMIEAQSEQNPMLVARISNKLRIQEL